MKLIQDKLVKCGFLYRTTTLHVGISRITWINLNPQQIILLANSIIRGYLNYYSFVFNKGTLTVYIFYIFRDVVLRTLAHKYKLKTRRKVYKNFGSPITIKDFNSRDKNNAPKILAKLYVPTNYIKNLWDFNAINIDTNLLSLYSENISLATLMKSKCSICLSEYRVEMHHIRMMKYLKPIKGNLDYLMAKSNRKQIPLCRDCHIK